MKQPLKYWVKERWNPQLGTSYYPMGQMSRAAARRAENTLYGSNRMHSYETKDEYDLAVAHFEKKEAASE